MTDGKAGTSLSYEAGPSSRSWVKLGGGVLRGLRLPCCGLKALWHTTKGDPLLPLPPGWWFQFSFPNLGIYHTSARPPDTHRHIQVTKTSTSSMKAPPSTIYSYFYFVCVCISLCHMSADIDRCQEILWSYSCRSLWMAGAGVGNQTQVLTTEPPSYFLLLIVFKCSLHFLR